MKLGKNFRKIVGYMPQQQGFYEDFSPMAFLKYMAEIKEVKKIKYQIKMEIQLLKVLISR